ncbi:MAG: sensor histidine kinase [Candidatus Thermoplasmatota archaeon]|nr:sensor histidine kinase [Candidatus Thermoplasmatota archaeon]
MIRLTLQLKVTLLFVSIFIVSLSVVFFFYLPQVEENLQHQAKNNLEGIALNTAIYLEHLIEDDLNKITLLSKNHVLRSQNNTVSEKRDELTTYRDQYHTFDEITLLDTNGIVVASTDYNYRGEWKTKSWYQESLQGSLVVTDAHVILDPWKLVILIISPLKEDTGSLIGVVAGQIDLEHYWGMIDSIKLGETGQLRIVNDQGRILYHLNRSKIFSRISEDSPLASINSSGSGSLQYTGGCHYAYLCGYTSLMGDIIFNEAQWRLMVSQQESEILSGLSDFKHNIFYGSVVFCFFLFVVGFFVSQSIVKPILRLQKGMDELAEGNFKYIVEVKGNNELTMLSKSFNLMGERLKELTDKIKERNQLVETLLKQKDDFIHQLGHDLKNPLGPLINLVPLLKKHEKDPKYLEVIDAIERNTHYMKNLVSKTLFLARLNSPNIDFNFVPVNLEKTIRNILQLNTMLLQENHVDVTLDVPGDIDISVDTLQFDELLTNLLNNAVKYSKDPRRIHVTAEKDNERVLVSIADNGIGITNEQLSRIFGEFYKADPARHDFDSSGLGMSIAKRIVEKHGGSIWVESGGLGKGSTFYFTIPLYDSVNQQISNQHDEESIQGKVDMLLQSYKSVLPKEWDTSIL